MVCSFTTSPWGPSATGEEETVTGSSWLASPADRKRARRWCGLTVPDLLHDELVKADLVDALVQAVGPVDVQHLCVQTLQLAVAQLWTQDPVVELLWRTTHTHVRDGAGTRAPPAEREGSSYPRSGRTAARARLLPASGS